MESSCYTLTMIDASADGWDNAYWFWKNGDAGDTAGYGNVLASGTMANGATATAQICSYARISCYDFEVTEGLYPSEVSWTTNTLQGSSLYDTSQQKGRGVAGEVATFCDVPTSTPSAMPLPAPTVAPSAMHTPAPSADDGCNVCCGGRRLRGKRRRNLLFGFAPDDGSAVDPCSACDC